MIEGIIKENNKYILYRVENNEKVKIKEVEKYTIPMNIEKYVNKIKHLNNITWSEINNLIFLGDIKGRYNKFTNTYKSAVQLGMEATTNEELYFVDAILSTYEAYYK